MDITNIREDFPVLKEKMNGKLLCYLDNAATTLKPKSVIDSMTNYYEKNGSSVHRGSYYFSYVASEMYEGVRSKVAGFINAPSDKTIVFTRGTSDSINIVASSYGLDNLKEGDEIILSEMAHNSLLLPFMNVAKKTGAKLVYIPLENGRITTKNFKSVLSDKTKFVAITHVTNVTGYIAPVRLITKMAHEVGAKVLIDCAQSAPHIKIDVTDMDADFIAFSGHKMCGPTGVGVLYGKSELLDSMEPTVFGGSMADYVTKESMTTKSVPYKFEAGTPMIAEVIGLGATVDYLQEIGMDKVYNQEVALKDFAIKQLKEIDGVTILNADTDTGIVTFNVDDVHPHDAASVYDMHGIALRAGQHCAQNACNYLGHPSTLRASFYFYNTYEEVDRFIQATKEAKEFFGYGF